MKAKIELIGDIIIYPIIALCCIVALSLLFVAGIIAVIICVLAVIFLLSYALVYFIGGGIWLGIDYFFIIHKEKIEGNVIALRKKTEKLFIPIKNVTGYENYDCMTSGLIPVYYQIIFITNYFLKIKKDSQWYTVKVPVDLYLQVQKGIKKGIKKISLECKKFDYDNFYELSSQI